MPEYRRHAFEKEWHDKVEDFIKDNDLAFDSPKYFIKFCVNRYMEEYERNEITESDLKGDSELVEKLKDEGLL